MRKALLLQPCEISSTADINKGLLHYYFQSKQALFASVMQMTSFELFPKIDSISSP
ncbi:MAG: helix-turn-helix transcriptional regulator [Holophagales bacterium]|nr:helix-turn-helix transcriptional regulator [Holophagales bacterium]